jgi:cytochrome b561/predicted heme/steroid binding protein
MFSRAEVEKYTGKNGMAPYFIIHNKVYDVTEWLNDHPGGPDILLESAGGDATEVFEGQCHSSRAKEKREEFLVGEIVPQERRDWKKVVLATSTQEVLILEFYHTYVDEQTCPLQAKLASFEKDHKLNLDRGIVAVLDATGTEVAFGAAVSQDQYPLNVRYTAGGKNAGFGIVPKIAAAAFLALYLQKAVNSGPISKLTYSKGLRHAHLLMALGLTGSVATAQAAAREHDDKKKQSWITLHKQAGMVMALALLVRCWLRLRSVIPARFPGPSPLMQLETASHKAFYALLFMLPSSGIAYGYISGTGVPLLGAKAAPDKDDYRISGQAISFHRKIGRLLEYVWLPFHFGVSAYHYNNGRDVIRKISPFL